MNTRTHLTLVPAIDDGASPQDPRVTARRRTTTQRPPGGKAAGAAALAAGLTLGLALSAVATLVTHPGTFGTLLLPVAGFIVGLGTAIGSGCTSGHGICGTAQRSPASWATTATFVGTAIVVTFILTSLTGLGDLVMSDGSLGAQP